MLGILPSFDDQPFEQPTIIDEDIEQLLRSVSDEPLRRGSVNAEHRTLELSAADVRELTHHVVASSGRGDTPFGSYVFSTHEPAAELARHVERSVLGEAFGCSPEMAAAAYDHYEPASLFLCVLDQRRCLPVGSVRVVVPSPCGFKSLDEIAHHWHQCPTEVLARTPATIDLARTWDIATLMVCPGYRTGTVSQALHQALGTASTHAGVTGYITILDVAVLRLLQFQLRRVFSHYDDIEAKYYEGSVSLPVWSDLPVYWERIQRSHPDLYETVFLGRNLEAAVSTPDWDEALERVGVRPYGVDEATAERRPLVLTGGVGT